MWIAEYREDAESAPQMKYLRGPICLIGRSAECDMLLLKDKAISRKHVEIHIEDNSLFAVDLDSKFFSYLVSGDRQTAVEHQLIPHEKTKVKSGDILLFGVLKKRVKLIYRSFLFTSTRLEPNDKEQLKALCTAIGAKCTDRGNDWTHVFANKFSATIKILTAIVFKKSLVTVDWLTSFADSTRCRGTSATIPPTTDYFPQQGDALVLANPLESRASILDGYLLFLTHKSHEQYGHIIAGCGARVVRLYSLPQSDLQPTIDEAMAAEHRVAALFFDDTVTVVEQMLAACHKRVDRLFSVGELAKAIIRLELPDEAAKESSQLPRLPVVENTFVQQSGDSIAVESGIFRAPSSSRSEARASPPRKPVVAESDAVSVPIPQLTLAVAVKPTKRPREEAVPIPATSPSEPVETKRSRLTPQAAVPPAPSPAVEDKPADASHFRFNLQIASVQSPAPVPAPSPPTVKVAKSSKRSTQALQASQLPPKVSAVSTEGWLTSHKTQPDKDSREVAPEPVEEKEEERFDYIVAETVEVRIPMRAQRPLAHAKKSSCSDFRRFKKNFVRRMDDDVKLSKRDMTLILPKESEREIQVHRRVSMIVTCFFTACRCSYAWTMRWSLKKSERERICSQTGATSLLVTARVIESCFRFGLGKAKKKVY